MALLEVALLSDDRLFVEALTLALDRQGAVRVVESPGYDGCNVILIDGSVDTNTTLRRLYEVESLNGSAKRVILGSDPVCYRDLIEGGAEAFIPWESSPAEVVSALERLTSGEVECPTELALAILERIIELREDEKPPPTATEPLTERELEVLNGLARGERNKEIGKKLGISVLTVKNHVHSILEKLRVHRRRDAIRCGFELGLLGDPDHTWPGAGEGDSPD
jgi:two-component system, NarL family, nitrate/nitrite response regulator NarL